MRGFDFLPGTDGHAEIAENAIMQAVDPTVHGEFLTPLPGVPDNTRLADIQNLFDDVQLTEPIDALHFVVESSEQRRVLVTHVLDVAQPVVHKTVPVPAQSRAHATTAVMAAYDDV